MPNTSQFDRYIERRGTGCLKWDDCHERFHLNKDEPVLPMWVADMDFSAPRPVIDAIVRRAQHGVFGYANPQPKTYGAIVNWVRRRYGWSIDSNWILFTPGIVSGLNLAVQALTRPGDGVLIQPPVYYPFAEIIRDNDRAVVNNPLVLQGGRYEMDFDDLERKAREDSVRMMILCSPHNPGGRVWSREELTRVAQICRDNGVVLASDEIHADLLMQGQTHIPTGTVSEEAPSNLVACYAPSKTFNLPGLQTAYLVIPDDKLRRRVSALLHRNQLGGGDVLALEALEAAYTQCDDYVDELCSYIEANMDHMDRYLQAHLPQLKLMRPQGTYLAWVDFRGTGMTDEAFSRFLGEKAHIAVDPGTWFGPGGEGFVRFNLACPRSLLDRALSQLQAAFDTL